MAAGFDLHTLGRSQLREALADAFQKLIFVKQSIENIPTAHVPFPRLNEVAFLEERIAEYQLELGRRQTPDTPVRIFYSYSRSDESSLVQLDEHLSVLKSEQPIEVFWDRNLSPGVEWLPETMAELRGADVVLLMISPDFLGSRHCRQVELPVALGLHECGLAMVIPVIIRSCSWQDTPLARLQAVTSGGVPVCEAKDREAAWAEAARSIFRMIDLIRAGKPSSSVNTV